MAQGAQQVAQAKPADTVSRAGRNLPAAIAVGVALGAAIIASLFTVRHLFIVIVAAAIAVGTWEMAGALRRGGGVDVALPPLLVGGQAMLWLAWPFGLDGVLVAFALTTLASVLWRFPGGATGFLRDATASVFVAAYVPLCAAFAVLLVLPSDGSWRVVAFLVTVVASDTGGYAAGVLFGKHPMAPRISPRKSWEGFAGSAVGAMIGATAVVMLALDGPIWAGVLIGAAVVVTATTGDLAESLMKRDLGIKDMGSVLPGHGGIMDRLDSLLPSAVVTWCLLSLLVPVP